MKIEFSFLGNATVYCVITLCSYGDTGDYEAFPTVPLSINSRQFAESLRLSGCDAIRYNSTRISFKHGRMEMTVFESGRMLFEQVSPNNQQTVGNLLKMFLANYSSSNSQYALNHRDFSENTSI